MRRGKDGKNHTGMRATKRTGRRRVRVDQERGEAPEDHQHGLPARFHMYEGIHRQTSYRLSPRVVLKSGDLIRVSEGPYREQVGPDGEPVRTRMAERGVMTFLEYCTYGTGKWVLAYGKAGYSALHVGDFEVSASVPGLVRRPYRIRKVRKFRARPPAGRRVIECSAKATQREPKSRPKRLSSEPPPSKPRV